MRHNTASVVLFHGRARAVDNRSDDAEAWFRLHESARRKSGASFCVKSFFRHAAITVANASLRLRQID